MNEKIEITVDGRIAETVKGQMLLTVLRDLGVHVPTLCHHPSLEPSGACRLCVVEITHPDWKGWSGLVTSCLYPAEPGLEVFTRSQRVMASRRTLLEMYLARCPDSREIRDVARAEGVDDTSFPAREDADLCIMCGLCVRVCNDLGPAAIAPLSRGTDKFVGPRPDRYGEDCTACGACALVCPTGEIVMDHVDRSWRIWNREFPIEVCRVTEELCRGCGACEEACPIAVPRVTPRRSGEPVAVISPTACVGCGICAGACPTGAITQKGDILPPNGDTGHRTVVYACSRSPLPADTPGLVPVPCIGRVPVETMLENLASGADGVLCLCRDQATCPHGLGGAMAESRIRIADGMAASAGLGTGRIGYARPPAGPGGPERALADHAASLTASPLEETWLPANGETGMDRAVEIMRWFRARPELARDLPEVDALLYLGDYHDLDLLLSLVVKHWRLGEIFEDAARILHQREVRFVPAFCPEDVDRSTAPRVVVFTRTGLPRFRRDVEVVTLDELAGSPPPGEDLPFRFRLEPGERRELLERFRRHDGTIPCDGPGLLAQARLLVREGAWHEAIWGQPKLAQSHGASAEEDRS